MINIKLLLAAIVATWTLTGCVSSVPTGTSSKTATTSSSVLIFDDCNFRGNSISLEPGYYDSADLLAMGLGEVLDYSVQIFNGFKLTVYSKTGYEGSSAVFTEYDDCVEPGDENYGFASVRVDTVTMKQSGNPVLPGWYADPEVAIFGERYWIYPTYSAPFDDQVFMDAFSSPDLVHWTKHPKIIEAKNISWAHRAMWAPSIIKKDDRYYLFFGANDIKNNEQPGGIGVAVSDKPEGPFIDLLGAPLIGQIHNGAQPIDQFVFQDVDGQYYMFYGGWRHCNVVKLNDDFTGLVPHDDGIVYKEVTPENYVEGSFMFRRNGKYYFMWSEGEWAGPDYSVAYAIADKPTGPFKRIAKILQQDMNIATGAGHHSVLNIPNTGDWYIVYHRRPLDQTDMNSRVVSIDRMHFDENGHIQPVAITEEGVEVRPRQ